jgi:hypothetical protein
MIRFAAAQLILLLKVKDGIVIVIFIIIITLLGRFPLRRPAAGLAACLLVLRRSRVAITIRGMFRIPRRHHCAICRQRRRLLSGSNRDRGTVWD